MVLADADDLEFVAGDPLLFDRLRRTVRQKPM
jgi:hypothetical protein